MATCAKIARVQLVPFWKQLTEMNLLENRTVKDYLAVQKRATILKFRIAVADGQAIQISVFEIIMCAIIEA